MKKILIVAYYFPPYGQVGAFRMNKLVKYFKQFGWDITVLTINERFYDKNDLDYSRLKEIEENIKIIRTEKLNIKLKFNEEGIYWGPKIFRPILKEIKKENYDYIYYTAGPFMHLWVAPVLKKITKIPYVLDYRDPWLLSPYNKSKKFKVAAKGIEPIVIKNAKYVLNVTEDATRMHIEHYKSIPKDKFITVENGYDLDDFKEITKKHISVKGIKFVYSGKLGSFRKIDNLLKSILEYNSKNKVKIYFFHLGKTEENINNFIKENPLSQEYIIQKGFLPYKEALSYIKACDIGVIISGGHPYEPTTKVYDYLALGKRILCLNDIRYGYLDDLLKINSNAVVCKNEEKDILISLNKIIEINNDKLKVNSINLDRKYIFQKLNIKLMEGITNEI